MVHDRKWPPFTWNVARALYIMWYKHLQSLKLLHPTIKVEMYLQENIVHELDCDNIAKFEVATFKLWVDAFTREYSIDLDLGSKVTLDFAQCPLYHVTYATPNFEVGTSNCLEEDAFTRKYIIDLGRMKYCLVSYASCDVCTYKVWSCYVQQNYE